MAQFYIYENSKGQEEMGKAKQDSSGPPLVPFRFTRSILISLYLRVLSHYGISWDIEYSTLYYTVFFFNRMVCVFGCGKMSMVYCLVGQQTHSLPSVFHMPSLQIPPPISLNMCHYCNFTLLHVLMQRQALSLWTVSPGGRDRV